MDIMVPDCVEMVMVAGETTRLSSGPWITALEEVRMVMGVFESCGGVWAGVGSGIRLEVAILEVWSVLRVW